MAIAAPIVIFTLVGGSLADSMDRRRLAILTTVGEIVISLLFLGLILADAAALWVVFTLVAVRSTIAAVGAPARKSVIPRLLPKDQLAAGLALSHLSFQCALLVGPAAAGALTGLWGVPVCFAINAVTFVAALYGVIGLPEMRPDGTSPRFGVRGVVQAAGFVTRTPTVGAALLCDLCATALAMPIALFPVINAERFGGAPETLGLFATAMGLGGITASSLSGIVTRARHPGRMLLAASATWGAALAAVGLVHNLAIALLLLAVAGGVDTLAVVARGAIVQLETPDAYRGRVSAMEHVIGAGVPHLGNFRGGLVASATSAAAAFMIGGVMCVTAIAAIAGAVPALRRLDVKD